MPGEMDSLEGTGHPSPPPSWWSWLFPAQGLGVCPEHRRGLELPPYPAPAEPCGPRQGGSRSVRGRPGVPRPCPVFLSVSL